MVKGSYCFNQFVIIKFFFSGIVQACQEIGIQLSSDCINELVADGLGSQFPSKAGIGGFRKLRPNNTWNPGIPRARVRWKANSECNNSHSIASLFLVSVYLKTNKQKEQNGGNLTYHYCILRYKIMAEYIFTKEEIAKQNKNGRHPRHCDLLLAAFAITGKQPSHSCCVMLCRNMAMKNVVLKQR